MVYVPMDIAQEIGKKWADFTKHTNGNFLRYKDGDMNNDAADNLEEVSAVDSMRNIDSWVVDWTMPLSQSEVVFVRANAQNFIALLNE